MHPALLPDGGLLVHDTGPLTKIDACGRVVWEIDGIFHHSVEPDADGLFWAAYSPPRSQEPGVGPRFSDDSVVAMSRRSPFANALALALWLPPFEAGRTPMKRFALLAAAMAFALPAAAQNAAQVSRAVAGTSCPGCNLFQADFGNKEMTGKSFAGARMRQSDMSAAVMNRTSFARADMRDVNAYGAVFTGANFSGADLTNASFVGTYLEGANLSGAKLSGTNFSGAEMDRAIGLHQAQLSAACGDESTKLPRGLSLRPCS